MNDQDSMKMIQFLFENLPSEKKTIVEECAKSMYEKALQLEEKEEGLLALGLATCMLENHLSME